VLRQDDTKARILGHSGAGKVPVLKHGAILVWESLAICEYLAESFPEARLWPAARDARAHARSASSEMHAGFQEGETAARAETAVIDFDLFRRPC
jgi:glutathione S-transferase